MLADLIQHVSAGELTSGEVAQAMAALLDPGVNEEDKASFLRAWTERGETAAELAACAETLLPRAVTPPVRGSWNGQPLLDCCGTGGGGLNLVNISTGIVFILAAMGVPVVKHGNRGLTKKSGSADVLEALGIRIDLPPEKMEACLEQVGAAFLFAPAFHTSFSVLAPVRRKLGAEGRRTVFNLLGPLLNPARPDARLVGVFTNEAVPIYTAALEAMGCTAYEVVCGEDNVAKQKIGEVSANGETLVSGTRNGPGNEPTFVLAVATEAADEFASLLVTGAEESANRLVALFSNNELGLSRETLLINAAVAAWAQGSAPTIEEGHARAAEALNSGQALDVLHKWQDFSTNA